MTSFVRKSAWNHEGGFDNPDLLWYAKGVGVMQSRELNDFNSWWFFAAIHGQLLPTDDPTTNPTGFPGWAFITKSPKVKISPPPLPAIRERYWDQCQHQSWFFLPWHRGYLMALEAQIRAAVVSLGGPSDWALPYWNYFGNKDGQDESRIPPAFTAENLPDGTPNPLFVEARYGPNILQPGNIFVNKDTLGGPNNFDGITAAHQNNTFFTGFDVTTTPSPGYGGPPTGFWHGGGTDGNLEANPHNFVHGDVGGTKLRTFFSVLDGFIGDLNNGIISADLRAAFQTNGLPLTALAIVQRAQLPPLGFLWVLQDGPRTFWIIHNEMTNMLDINSPAAADTQRGLMSFTITSALDPIFYLHHCNIDRMWAAWNAKGNSNLTNEFWVDGPATIGMSNFVMPMPDDDSWEYTPIKVGSLDLLDYVYEEMNGTISPQPANELVPRLMKLGVEPAAANAAEAQGADMGGGGRMELLGANDGTLKIEGLETRATVRLDRNVQRAVFASLENASATNLPERVYLHLENVRGTNEALKLSVSVNQQPVGSVALFGLWSASSTDGRHGGMGRNFIFDITDVMDNLFLANTPDVNSLDVSIKPNIAFVDETPITVGRISVYRRGGQ